MRTRSIFAALLLAAWFGGSALFVAHVARADDKGNLTSIPFKGDETPFGLVKADPKDYRGKPFIIIGGLTVSDLYTSTYSKAKDTHYVFACSVATPNAQVTDQLYVYAKKSVAKPLLAAVAATEAEGSMKTVRLKLTIDPRRFSPDDGAGEVELLDWQLLAADRKDWGPWALSAATKPATKPAPSSR